MSWAEWGSMLVLSVLWGGSFFFSKIAVTAFPPLTIVCLRFAAASVIVFAYARVRGLAIPTDRRSWAAFAGMGLLNNLVPAGLIVWGQTMIASGLASVIIATTPIFSMLPIHATGMEERLSWPKLTGMLLGLAGVAVLLRAGTRGAWTSSTTGILACLGAALSYGLANALGARFRRLGIAPPVSALGQMTSTAIMSLPLMLALETPWRLPLPGMHVWAAMAGLAGLSTALGYIVFFRLLATAGATNVSLVTLLIPVSAVLLGCLVLGEQVSAIQGLGMALITSGLIAIDGRAMDRARQILPRSAGSPP